MPGNEVETMSDRARIRKQFEARLGWLTTRLDEIEQILCEPEEDDLEEQAGEWDDDNVLHGLARMIREEIGLIQEAVRRLEEGAYGRCRGCGRRIGQRRLRVLPQATVCVRCARVAA
jgi:RNA polymerase-binding transcription factor DksA